MGGDGFVATGRGGGGRDGGRKSGGRDRCGGNGGCAGNRRWWGGIRVHRNRGGEMHLDVLELRLVVVKLAEIMVIGRRGFWIL